MVLCWCFIRCCFCSQQYLFVSRCCCDGQFVIDMRKFIGLLISICRPVLFVSNVCIASIFVDSADILYTGHWRTSQPVDSSSVAENCLVILRCRSAAGPCSIRSDPPGGGPAARLHDWRGGWSSSAGRRWRGRVSWGTGGAVRVSGALSRSRRRAVQGTSLADVYHRRPSCLP